MIIEQTIATRPQVEQAVVAGQQELAPSAGYSFKKVDEFVHPLAKVSRVARYGEKLASSLTKVPHFVKTVLKPCKLLKTIRGVGFVKKLTRHTLLAGQHLVTAPKKAPKDLVKVARDVKKVVASAAFPCKTLHSWGVVPDVAVAWIPAFSAIHPFISLSSLGMAVSGYKKAHTQSSLDEQRCALLDQTQRRVRQVRVMTELLGSLRGQDLKALQKKLGFSKDVHLAQRIDRISSQLLHPRTQTEALVEGEQLLRTIADRSSHLAKRSILRVGVKVVKVAGWAMYGFLGLPTVGLGLLTLTAAVTASCGRCSIACFHWRYITTIQQRRWRSAWVRATSAR